MISPEISPDSISDQTSKIKSAQQFPQKNTAGSHVVVLAVERKKVEELKLLILQQ